MRNVKSMKRVNLTPLKTEKTSTSSGNSQTAHRRYRSDPSVVSDNSFSVQQQEDSSSDDHNDQDED